MADVLNDSFSLLKNPVFSRLTMLPSPLTLARLSDATRCMTEAQMAFGQAMMQANTAMFEAWFAAPAQPSESPSVAARMCGDAS